MKKNNLLLAALIGGLVWAQSEAASAQSYATQRGALTQRPPARGARSYRPSSPTMSPYLNLLRTNTSAVPNYYSFVRPQQRQQEFNRQEQTLRQKQAQTLGKVQNDVQLGQSPIRATGTGGGFMQGGSRSTFMNSSRYYSR